MPVSARRVPKRTREYPSSNLVERASVCRRVRALRDGARQGTPRVPAQMWAGRSVPAQTWQFRLRFRRGFRRWHGAGPAWRWPGWRWPAMALACHGAGLPWRLLLFLQMKYSSLDDYLVRCDELQRRLRQ